MVVVVVLALMWPSFERGGGEGRDVRGGGGGEMCFASKEKKGREKKNQHLPPKCSFSREAGGIRRSSLGFTGACEGSLSWQSLSRARAHTQSRLIVLTAGKLGAV